MEYLLVHPLCVVHHLACTVQPEGMHSNGESISICMYLGSGTLCNLFSNLSCTKNTNKFVVIENWNVYTCTVIWSTYDHMILVNVKLDQNRYIGMRA